ncbi:hypothetical protein GN244_ATG18707 [Phytophthora infestans]|uniref:Uncharacterized protein n=1 Tax=Phytophthora infestans TaxID=4787 RepID=A0A833S6I7_PHYIN|nr:hypothetical protein GN244_ATG18707 [Phytophthora infestans]KAF4138966.1 hypothetical protein GN958_ATG11923 [Phytophthora infestans]
MTYLYEHTSYFVECRASRPRREYYFYTYDDWSEVDSDYLAVFFAHRERVKKRMGDQCMRNPHPGLTLPRKWERLRDPKSKF